MAGAREEQDRSPARLRASADAEKRLLTDEQTAERAALRARKRLEEAAEDLRRAQDRYDRRRAAVEAADAELRAAHHRRALGPTAGEGVPGPDAR